LNLAMVEEMALSHQRSAFSSSLIAERWLEKALDHQCQI